MDALQIIAPLVGVVLGSLISGIGVLWRSRVERKSLIARALSDLLEIRHQVVSVELTLRELKNRVAISEDDAVAFRTHMNTVMPLDENIHQRYDEAITLLSGIDPLLAFSMRSKNKIPVFFESIRKLSISLGINPSQASTLESIFRLSITPALDEAALKLATLHSWKSKKAVRSIVKKTNDVSPEITKLINQVVEESQKTCGNQRGQARN
jgi:hypothetical protein